MREFKKNLIRLKPYPLRPFKKIELTNALTQTDIGQTDIWRLCANCEGRKLKESEAIHLHTNVLTSTLSWPSVK